MAPTKIHQQAFSIIIR